MAILTVLLCSLALGWLLIRIIRLLSIPIDDAIKILSIAVPRSPVVSIDSVTDDSVGLHWDCSDGSQTPTSASNSTENIPALNQNNSPSGISHYLLFVNGIESAKVPGSEKSAILTDLTPNSHYQVDLVAFNNLNFRSKSCSIFVRTNDNCNNSIDQQLLNIAHDSTQVLPCDPKLLYEDNVDEKLMQQVQLVQNGGGRSRSNTLDNTSIISFPTFTFPTPSEITNMDDLKYHLEKAQEDLKNTMNQRDIAMADFIIQEKEYKFTLSDLSERMKIEDKNRASAKQEASLLENSKLKLKGRINKANLSLISIRAEIRQKERAINEFESTLSAKAKKCDELKANEDTQAEKHTREVEEMKRRILDFTQKNQSLEDSVKFETATRKRLESLRTKLTPLFTSLARATNSEGELEKEGFSALAELKHEHAEWYQIIKTLIDRTSQDRAHSIAKKAKIESKLEQHRKHLVRLQEETDALRAAKKENASNLFRNTYLNKESASSYTNMNLMAALGNGKGLAHQRSVPSLSDHISTTSNVVNSSSQGWSYPQGTTASQTASLNTAPQFNTTSPLNDNDLALPMLPNELFNDDGEAFFNSGSASHQMQHSDTFYSATSNSNNPFGGIPENVSFDYGADALNYTSSMRYASQIDNSSLNLSVHGSNGNSSPSYPLAASPPTNSYPLNTPSVANIGGSGLNALSSVYSNDSFLPNGSHQNHDFLPLNQAVFSSDASVDQKDSHESSFSPRRLSKTFNFFKSNEPPTPAGASSAPNSSNIQQPTYLSSMNTSRFFNRKKTPKIPDETFASPFVLSPGIDSLSPANVSRDRSGSFNSHTSNRSTSIWNNNTNSGTNFQRFLESPAQQRQSFEMVSASSPKSNTTSEPQTPAINILQSNMAVSQVSGDTSEVFGHSPSMTDHLSDNQIRKYSTQSSTSNLSREDSNLSTTSSQALDVPASPSYFKKFFAGTSPSKHEKAGSINSTTISTSGDSEFAESTSGSTRGKLFKISRKNSTGTMNSSSTTNSKLGDSLQPPGAANSNGPNGGPGTVPHSSTAPSSSTTSKKFKNFLFQKRKPHDDGVRTDTEETIEEASDESSSKD